MKILNIMTSSLTYNGISMSVMNYFRNIDNEKIQIDFVVPNKVKVEIKKEIEEKKGKIYELNCRNHKMRQRKPIKYCKKLYEILKKEKYDAIHVHGSSAMMFMEMVVAKKAGCQIRIAHSRNTKSNYRILHYLCKPFFRNSYTTAFSCGKEAGKWLFGNNKNIIIIPNGKDCESFKFNKKIRNEYRNKYNIEDKKIIGHVGNFNFQKNHEYLIKIFYELTLIDDKYYLVLAGEGKLEKDIRKQIKKLNIEDKVLFLGQISGKEVSNWLQAMDIMVFPSRFEGFPNVLIEWQIAGLPCIISDKITQDVKITELVKFLSISDEPKKWARIIDEIKNEKREIKNKEIIKEIKEKGYDIKENARRLQNIYLNLNEEKNEGNFKH